MRAITVSRITGLAALTAFGILAPLTIAGAAEYPNGGPPPEVSPNRERTTVANRTAVKPTTLPLTGTDVAELVAIGGAAVGAGLVMTRRSRHRTPA